MKLHHSQPKIMSEDAEKERPIIKVPIEVYKDKEIRFQLSLLKLRVFYEKKQDVPKDVIQDLFSCMKIYPRRDIKQLTKQIGDYTQDSIDYFDRQTKYKYNFKVTVIYKSKKGFNRDTYREDSMRAIKGNKLSPDETEYTYTLRSLLHYLYDELMYTYPNLLVADKRRECIQYLYKKLVGYLNKLNVSEDDFGKYKRCVVIGYIVSKFGHTMTEKQKGSRNYNEYLFRSVNKVI